MNRPTTIRATEDIVDIIAAHARLVLPSLQAHAFSTTDRLADLGANSVDRMEIVMMTLETLSLRVPMSEMHGATNIGHLAELLHEKLPSI